MSSALIVSYRFMGLSSNILLVKKKYICRINTEDLNLIFGIFELFKYSKIEVAVSFRLQYMFRKT